MPETTRLTAQVTRLLDEEKYEEALELVWETALAEPPKESVINLLIARLQEEMIGRLRLLDTKYPGLPATKKGVLLLETDNFSATNAARICSHILEKWVLNFEDEIEFRWLRFLAFTRICVTDDPETYANPFVEDFRKLWGFEGRLLVTENAGHLMAYERRMLVKKVSEINCPKAIPILERLSSLTELPPPVKRFLEMKAHELRMLADLLPIIPVTE